MKRTMLIFFIISWILVFPFGNPLPIQYTISGNSIFKIRGTSTLHDWEMISHSSTGESVMEIYENRLQEVASLHLKIPAKSLKSGINAMDKIAYSSLKANSYPAISFIFRKIESSTISGDSIFINASGNLFVAGKSRIINIKTTGKIQKEEIYFEGRHSMRMTDFDIIPPAALLGTLKTGDSISVYFKVLFKPKKPL